MYILRGNRMSFGISSEMKEIYSYVLSDIMILNGKVEEETNVCVI